MKINNIYIPKIIALDICIVVLCISYLLTCKYVACSRVRNPLNYNQFKKPNGILPI